MALLSKVQRWPTLGVLAGKMSVARIYNRSQIGSRDVVGFGINGSYNYRDDPHFPFPAIRFKENTADIAALRQKEQGDWHKLTKQEKKCLYRASFCCTFAEFQCATGIWKLVLGVSLILMSFAFWLRIFMHYFVNVPLPASFSDECQKAQLRRMLDLRVNPIDGLSSRWDYELDKWKS